MGGSRRRLKKGAAKVRVGLIKTKKIKKSSVPREITEQRPALEKRLQTTATWKDLETTKENYEANKLVLDPNALAPRHKARTGARTSATLVAPEERLARGEEIYDDDDELRAGCNLERKTGKALPPRLTTTQKKMLEGLLAAHGDDMHAAMLDRKLNPMQHSEGQLKKLVEGYRYWGADGQSHRHNFFGPNKPYKL